VGDGAALPFPDGSFDLVRIERVLHLLDAPEAVAGAAAAALRPGGRLVVAEPLWASLACPAVDSLGAEQVAALLAESGGLPGGRVEAALELPRMATAAGLAVEGFLPGEASFPDVEEAFDLLHIERRLAAAMLARRLPVAVALGWLQAQRALGAKGAFLARMEGRTLIARKP
jgi:SAM-dependent methyltransferase